MKNMPHVNGQSRNEVCVRHPINDGLSGFIRPHTEQGFSKQITRRPDMAPTTRKIWWYKDGNAYWKDITDHSRGSLDTYGQHLRGIFWKPDSSDREEGEDSEGEPIQVDSEEDEECHPCDDDWNEDQ